jgi:branched-chain amino acid aminotransferase
VIVMATQVYVDGRFVPKAEATVSVFDHGLLYGDGVFEGIRAYNGRVFELEAHVRRLFASAKAICLALPWSEIAMCDIVLETCRRNAIEDGYIRLVVTRGRGDLGIDPRRCTAGPSIIVIAEPRLVVYEARERPGVRMVTSAHRRNAPDALNPSIKSLNYLNNVLAKIEANQRGVDEALLLDAQGYVAEATVDNLFVVRGTTLMTPWTSTNLAGITRDVVIRLARRRGWIVEERPFALYDVWSADEVVITGTAIEIQAVVEVDGRSIGAGVPGPVSTQLAADFLAYARGHGVPIDRVQGAEVQGAPCTA